MPPLPDPCFATLPAPAYLHGELFEYTCSLETGHATDHEDESRGRTWPRKSPPVT